MDVSGDRRRRLAVVDVVISQRRLMLKLQTRWFRSGSLLSYFLQQPIFALNFLVKFRRRTAMDATLMLPNVPPPGFKSFSRSHDRSSIRNRHRFRKRISAIGEVSAITSDPILSQITWQIIVGSIAGVTPFVIAGIEFSKRIVAQKQCVQCGGSGLVLMEKEYIRCPNCGGFLPWQSWKRFFSG